METKVVYYLEENAKSDIPYLIRLPTPSTGVVTLGDLKKALSTSVSSIKSYKYYFQMHEEGVGNVRVEVSDDSAQLPRQGETITCWLIAKDNSDSTNNNNENIDTTGRGVMNRKTISSKQLTSGISNNNMQQQMIYDSMEIGRRGSFKPAGRTTPLKDLNCDDFNLTETDSLANAFDDLRMNRAGSIKSNMNIINNPSIKKPIKPQFNSFNNHVVKAPARQLSLDPKQGRHAQKHLPPPPFKTKAPFFDSFEDTASSDDDDDSSITTLMHGGHHYLDTKSTVNDQDTIDDDTTALTQTDFTQTNTQSILSSELEEPTTTFFDTENDFADDDDEQFSAITIDTRKATKARKKAQKQIYMKHDSLHSSMTSISDSTISLNFVTVVLDMTANSFLGITIVGQRSKGSDGGIFVGSVQKNGAVALNGCIEPGDLILQVNETSFENLSNEEAVACLREAAKKPGPLKLVVAKCWGSDSNDYFTVSKNEPVRPIDPRAWVAHAQAHINRKDGGNYGESGNYGNYHSSAHRGGHHNRLTRSISSFGSSSTLNSSDDDTGSTLSLSQYSDNYTRGGNYNHHNPRALPYNPYRHQQQQNTITTNNLDLTTESDMETVVRTMAAPTSGLDIGDHEWLKMRLSNTFLGFKAVQWLFNHVEGFPEVKDARKYASQLLRHGYIKHALERSNKFSQKCLYRFGDFNDLGATTTVGATLAPVNEESETEIDSVSEYNERNNYYMPQINKVSGNKLPAMTAPGSYMTTNMSQQPYQHIKSSNYASSQSIFGPKIYSHMNSGLGGPPPPPSYVSSSSSNATSTSTASNNTTSLTIGTAISSGKNNERGMIVSSNPAACQFYFAPPQPPSSQPPPHANLHLTSYTNDDWTTNSQMINNSTQLANSMFLKNETTLSQTIGSFSASQASTNSTTIENGMGAGGPGNMTSNPPNSMVSHFDTTAASSQSGGSSNNSGLKYITSHFKKGTSNKSSKSSDASSSGHGSDMELLSSKSRLSKKQQNTVGNVFYQQQQHQQHQTITISSSKSSNYYEINKLAAPQQQQYQQHHQSKPLEKVTREHRVSKQSFLKAMDNPCNIVDAI